MSRQVCSELAFVLLFGLLSGCQQPADASEAAPSDSTVTERITVEPRTHLLPTFPCSSCHADREPNPKRRRLEEFHRLRYDEFLHGDDQFWCYQCHARENIDRLQLPNGKLVSFDEGPELCTACHGDKREDWRDGIHGVQQGQWNGQKIRRACPACHNPHNPRFKALEPEKPPDRPRGVETGGHR